MKVAKSVAVDTPALRRAQPARQARSNPPRNSAIAGRSGDGRRSVNRRPLSSQPIDIFPAITHFADTMSALPKELVRHFTLLKEVDAKIFAPEEQLFKLVAAAANSNPPELRVQNDASSTAPPASTPMSAQNSSSGRALNHAAVAPSTAPSIDGSIATAPTSVFDSSNIPRRQLFRQTAYKIQDLLVSLEEKNHVLSTANEALQRQLARVEDVWPYLENEFSDEAKWGSNTHWAYPENRTGGKASHTEKVRRDGAAAISAAAQALADEAAARSDARKQAVQAKKSLKNQHHDSDADDLEGRQKETAKKTGKSRKSAAMDTNSVATGTSSSTVNGNHPQKRRKVEKTTNGAVSANSNAGANAIANTNTNGDASASGSTSAGAGAGTNTKASASVSANSNANAKANTSASVSASNNGSSGLGTGAMSLVFGNSTVKPKTSSPRGTPAPDGPKKRKALPTGSGQAKKRNGMSPSATPTPVIGSAPEPRTSARESPAPGSAPRPVSSRATHNFVQSNADSSNSSTSGNGSNSNGSSGKAHPTLSNDKPNGHAQNMPEQASTAILPRPGPSPEAKPGNDDKITIQTENSQTQKEAERPETRVATPPTTTNKIESKPEDAREKHEHNPSQTPVPPTVTTKSGRASKPSTPALATFQEAAASRSRPSRNIEGTSSKKGHAQRKNSIAAQSSVQQLQPPNPSRNSANMQGDDEDGDMDADEPTYCYCNNVSYGEMVACDADGCEREWFHLACVGLKVAPNSKTKWYCEDCKERLKMGGRKPGR